MLNPDHDGKQVKNHSRCSQGGDRHSFDEYGQCFECDAQRDDSCKLVRLSRVYPRPPKDGENRWAFNITIGDKSLGHEFGSKEGAVRSRAVFQKRFKKNGFIVHCVH